MKGRSALIAVTLIVLATIVACGGPAATPTPTPKPAPTATTAPVAPAAPKEIALEFLSSAEPRTDGEKAVSYLADLFLLTHPYLRVTWRAVALPDSVNQADKLSPDVRKHTFPAFLTPTDFLPARAGGGPAQHKYDRAYTDLLFAANLSSGGWTFITRNPELAADPKKLVGKTIGMPYAMDAPVWGSPQLLGVAILKDAWGILDQVKLVPVGMPYVMDKFNAGEIDAAFWGIPSQMSNGTFAMPGPFTAGLQATQHYLIPVTQADADKINAANPWKISLVTVPKGSAKVPGPPSAIVNPPTDVTVPEFGWAWAPWKDTEEDIVYEMLSYINKNIDKIKADGVRVRIGADKWAQWPGLTSDMVHPGALRFYKEQGITIGK